MSVGRRRFRIINEIAEGGFGKVYLAEQMSSDGFSRIVAVKLLHAKWSSHDEVVMRTRDEARLLGLIRHQNIVKVEDLTSIDGKCAIVMEYLEGVDLKWMTSFLKGKGEVFPRAALFEIILAVASALDAAYNGTQLQGGEPLRVIHRDIKPSNIFATTAGNVKVLDFGTARANFAEREAKTQALAFGSQGYMAPERMLGEEDTPAADIFSLGVTLYELLSQESFGRIPPRPNKFEAKVAERVGALELGGTEDWHEQIRETLRLMMSYNPDERPSAAQLVEIMELLVQEADDMGLRRFSRGPVAEAKTALPQLDTGDPLAGTIVDEDASSSFPLGGSTSGPQVPHSPGAPIPSGFDSLQGMAPPPPPPMVTGPQQTIHPGSPDQAPPVEPYVSAPQEVRPSGRSSGVMMLAGCASVFGLSGVLAIAGFGWWMMSNSEPAPVASMDPAPTGVAEAPEQAEPPAPGGQVTNPDGREDAPVSPTTLRFSDPAGAKVVIKGPSGFTAEWDGTSDWDLKALGEGRYTTMISREDGTKIRGKSFTVDGGKASCSFTFELDARNWTGGCE